MSWPRRKALALIAAAGLSGCGFRPMLHDRATVPGSQQPISGALASVYVRRLEYTPVTEPRFAQQVRNALIDRIGVPDTPSYVLDGTAHLGESDRASRYLLQGVVMFTLKRLPTQAEADKGALAEIVWKGQERGMAFYDLQDNQFTTEMAQRDAEARVAEELGEQLARHLAAWFSNPVAVPAPK